MPMKKSSLERTLSLSLSSFLKRLMTLAWFSSSHCSTLCRNLTSSSSGSSRAGCKGGRKGKEEGREGRRGKGGPREV